MDIGGNTPRLPSGVNVVIPVTGSHPQNCSQNPVFSAVVPSAIMGGSDGPIPKNPKSPAELYPP